MMDATFLRQACDTHIHFGPDTVPRRMSALELARAAARAGMRAIMLKSHNVPTYAVASCVDEAVDGVRVFGGLVLNAAVGGVNPDAVRVACQLGARQIWMPTSSARRHLRHFHADESGAVDVFDPQGSPAPHLEEVLKMVADTDIILGTGHLGPQEIVWLTDVARACGVKKILATHPEFECVELPLTVQRDLADKGVFFERCFYASNSRQKLPVREIARQILAVGPQSTVIASDMGQAENPPPAEALLDYLRQLAACGLSERQLAYMVKELPAALLGL